MNKRMRMISHPKEGFEKHHKSKKWNSHQRGSELLGEQYQLITGVPI